MCLKLKVPCFITRSDSQPHFIALYPYFKLYSATHNIHNYFKAVSKREVEEEEEEDQEKEEKEKEEMEGAKERWLSCSNR